MPKSTLPQPTPAELEILQVLWREGPCTVREVQQRLDRRSGYTTVLKLLQIMTQKGLTRRDEGARTHVYRAAAPEASTKRRLVSDLLDRAFEGSAAGLVVQALSAKRATPAELRRIRELLDQLEEGET
jgi:BlaI family transcriptional regulator, penicillinase repressor